MDPDRFLSNLDGVIDAGAAAGCPCARLIGEGGKEKDPCADIAAGGSGRLEGLLLSAPDSAELAGDMMAEARLLRGAGKARGM